MKDLFSFLVSKSFLRQILYIALFLILVLLAVLAWLRVYTHHGQKLALPDYTDVSFEEARKDAKNNSFSLTISDSVHIVGKAGGLIIDQNPKGGSMVKEKRKIYVTTTKYNPDNILVNDLPLLYGTDYDQAKSDLKSRFINAEIKARKFDAGQPNHILEVWYDDKLIIDRNKVLSTQKVEKGGTLRFVVSEQKGGSFPIPDLICRQLSDAQSYMLYSKLKIGKINKDASATEFEDPSLLWITSQWPKPDLTSDLTAGSPIDITVSKNKPKTCQ